MKGYEAILRQFLANGIDHMFGNPGTVEQSFLDALEDLPQIKYILTLQESIAVLCADGYARSKFKPALVQVHSSPGLGNAIGNLYQAFKGQSPLVVIGGDAGIKYQALDAQMAADLVAMAEPVTKWSAMVQHHTSLLRMVRRAIKIASTPPCGPVYLCLPEDILDQDIEEDIFPAHIPDMNSGPDRICLESVIPYALQAKNPIILVGDGLAWSYKGCSNISSDDNLTDFVELAEQLGAKVYEADGGEVNFPRNHPLYFGSTGHMFGFSSLPLIKDADFILILGCYLFPEVFPHLGEIFSPKATVIHVDLNSDNIAKNHRVDKSFVCNPYIFTKSFLAEIKNHTTPNFIDSSAARVKSHAIESQGKSSSIPTTYEANPKLQDEAYDDKKCYMKSGYFMKVLSEKLPEKSIIFDEALTNSPPLSYYMPGCEPGDRLMTRGGSLGTGFPGAIGVKLANPNQTVIGFSGDGGSMYTIQCLWTAARHDVHAKFIVCQNRSYRLLQANITQYWKERGITGRSFPTSFDLSNPEIYFEDIAKSMGVAGERVWKPSQVAPAIERMLEHNGPYLINLILDGDVHPELISVRCGQ